MLNISVKLISSDNSMKYLEAHYFLIVSTKFIIDYPLCILPGGKFNWALVCPLNIE